MFWADIRCYSAAGKICLNVSYFVYSLRYSYNDSDSNVKSSRNGGQNYVHWTAMINVSI